VKSDPDVKNVSKAAVRAIGKAMECYILKHAKDALYCSKRDGRKTIHEKDVATAIYRNDELEFLRPTFDLPTSSIKKRPLSASKKPTKSKRRKIEPSVKCKKISSFFSRKVES